ncbi:FIST signal transduction protein [Sorangium sp. So ce131]|uniref:FIST signal transduction protein n=1 Tax=Sorangium sp. So ce131 TaxID=3133282 RepID=UPI003F5E5CA9
MIEATTVSIVHEDAREAGRLAAVELLDRLSRAPDLVIVFAPAHVDGKAVLEGLFSRLPKDTQLAGCSTAGEINSDEVLSDSVTAMGLCSRDVEFRTFKVEGIGADAHEAGRALAAQVKAFDPALLLLFPDALAVSATRLLDGLQSVLGPEFPVLGGMAADSVKYTGTFQYWNREALTNSAVAVGMKGRIELVTRARSGWTPMGAPRTCTRVENGSTLLALDGRPALELYEEYLGERARDLPTVSTEFPLGLVSGIQRGVVTPDDQILVCRGVRGVDRERGAMLLGGDIPEGGQVRMMRATKEDVIKASSVAGALACDEMPDPTLAFFFNCAARKVVLGWRYRQDVQALFRRLGPSVPKIGFFTYGEFCPTGGVSLYHEVTFTVALLRA